MSPPTKWRRSRSWSLGQKGSERERIRSPLKVFLPTPKQAKFQLVVDIATKKRKVTHILAMLFVSFIWLLGWADEMRWSVSSASFKAFVSFAELIRENRCATCTQKAAAPPTPTLVIPGKRLRNDNLHLINYLIQTRYGLYLFSSVVVSTLFYLLRLDDDDDSWKITSSHTHGSARRGRRKKLSLFRANFAVSSCFYLLVPLPTRWCWSFYGQ